MLIKKIIKKKWDNIDLRRFIIYDLNYISYIKIINFFIVMFNHKIKFKKLKNVIFINKYWNNEKSLCSKNNSSKTIIRKLVVFFTEKLK